MVIVAQQVALANLDGFGPLTTPTIVGCSMLFLLLVVFLGLMNHHAAWP